MSTLPATDRISTDIKWGNIRPWLAVFILQVYLVIAYFELSGATPTNEPRYLVYPLVWMTVGAWAMTSVDLDIRSKTQAVLAGGIGLAYYLLLLWIPGNIGLAPAGGEIVTRVELYAPGWGPLVVFTGPYLRLFLVPFEVIGYAGLAVLVSANVLTFSRGALSGVLGLVTCVGCTVPVMIPLLGLLGGPATSMTTTAYAYSYDIGTVLYVLTVILLYRGATG